MKFDFFEHIEAYKAGTLDSELKTKMEQAIASDSNLQQHLDNYESAAIISEILLEEDILSSLEDLDEKRTLENKKTMAKESNQSKNSSKVIWSLLVLVLAFVGIWYFMYRPASDSIDTEEQVASKYERPINENATKSGDLDKMSNFERGKYYFDLNDFEQAEYELGQAVLTNLDPKAADDIYYWLAHAQFQQQKFALTRKSLSLSKHPDAKKLMQKLKEVYQNKNKQMEDPGR